MYVERLGLAGCIVGPVRSHNQGRIPSQQATKAGRPGGQKARRAGKSKPAQETAGVAFCAPHTGGNCLACTAIHAQWLLS